MAEVGFCVDSVYVNGMKHEPIDEVSAFEIKIDSSIKKGDFIKVEIYHQEGCVPKNLAVHTYPSRTIEFSNLAITDSAIISADVNAENRILLCVEQYRWNKWIKISEEIIVDSLQIVSFDVSQSVHSGQNKFRLCSRDAFSKKVFSKARTLGSTFNHDGYKIDRAKKVLTFEQPTRFELFDAYGNLVKMGEGDNLDLTNLKSGAYYLNYDNVNTKIKF